MLAFALALLVTAVATYLVVSIYRRPARAAAIDDQMRKDCVQLCAHVLAANDTGWALPDPVVDLAHKILATKEIHQ